MIPRLLVCLLLAHFVLSISAQEPPPKERTVNLTSRYNSEGFKVGVGGGARRVLLKFSEASLEGALELDPNKCMLDEFGEVRGSTLGGRASHKVRLKKLGNDLEGRVLYSVVAEGINESLRLLLPRDLNGEIRLIVSSGKDAVMVISMFPQ